MSDMVQIASLATIHISLHVIYLLNVLVNFIYKYEKSPLARHHREIFRSKNLNLLKYIHDHQAALTHKNICLKVRIDHYRFYPGEDIA